MEETCPCELCISLAICYQKRRIHCKDLYLFLCYTNVNGFKAYRCENGPAIPRIYNRYVGSTKFGEFEISLLRDKSFRNMKLHGDIL